MSSIPLAALSIRPPAQPTDPLEQFSRLQAIRGLMQRQQLEQGQQQLQQQQIEQEQQLNPLRVASAEQNVESAKMENQLKQIDLDNVKHAQEYWTDPSKFQGAAGTAKTSAGTGFAENALGVQSDDPLAQHINGMIQAGVNPTQGPNSALAQGKQLLDFRANVLTQTADQQKVTTDGLATINKILTPIAAEPDPAKRTTMLQQASPTLEQASRFDPSIHQAVMTADPNHLDKITAMTGALKDITDYGKEQREADPVYKWTSDPDELAKPGAQAAIQAQIDDPKTDEPTANRLKALLPKAQVAQNNVINMKEREQRAQQAVTQGGTAGAQALAKMLVDRSITVDEMKVRGLTPQFEAQVFGMAQQMDPTWKAPEAAAQSRIAAAPANQQFFGNTDSLLVKGGTLDQLSAAGKNIPQNQFPAFNTVNDIIDAARGKGPLSAYAAAILGVADDYSKVMGGTGGGSDTARSQALGIFAAKLSPEAREAAINQVRQSVLSQRQGRIGQNPYLKDMYPEPQNAGASPIPSGNIVVTLPGGRQGHIAANQWVQFLRDNPGATRQ